MDNNISSNISAIVLAAGQGTRMQSALPKVLHRLGSKTIIEHVLDALIDSRIEQIVLVLGKNYQDFKAVTQNYREIIIAIQKQQRGTGDAVASAAPAFNEVHIPSYCDSELVGNKTFKSDYVLLCTGDTPALNQKILTNFIEQSLNRKLDFSILAFEPDSPKGYGRIICDKNEQVTAIIEDRDCNDDQSKLSLCNSGILMAKTDILFEYLDKLSTKNSQNEYYLTDCARLATQDGLKVGAIKVDPWQSLLGINTKDQLKEMENYLYPSIKESL